MEIGQAPHLGPGAVDADGDQRQRQVRDPDAEVFLCASGESDRLPGGVRGLGW